MKRSVGMAAFAAAVGVLSASQEPAYADGVTVPGASITQQSPIGIYLRVDGSYQTVDLPSIALGLQGTTPSLHNNAGKELNFRPSAHGDGLNGAIGYVLPPGWIPQALGTDARVEFGVNYVNGTGSQTPTAIIDTGNEQGAQLLNGAVRSSIITCGGAIFTCAAVSKIHTDFTSFNFDLKAQSDFHIGPFILTPSAALLGGQSDNNNALSQTLTGFLSGAAFATNAYSANIKLHSDDDGAKLGIDANTPITNLVSLGFGGSMAAVHRSASLTGTDAFVQTVFVGTSTTSSSGISTHRSTAAFLANLETHADVSPMPGVLLRAFVGANFDNAVAGISTPNFTGSSIAPTAVAPAGIKFSSEIGWYVGGGAIARF